MDTQQHVWQQKKEKILEQLTPGEVQRLMQRSVRLVKKRGEFLWPADEGIPRVYIVDQGFLRLCRISDEGKRLILSILGPSEFFGVLFADLMQSEADNTLEVVRDARLIGIETAVFQEVLQSHPDMALRLAQILEERKYRLEQRITSLFFKDVEARTAELLLDLCGRFGAQCPHADPPQPRDITLTHQEIADMAGAARPTVSRILSDWMKAGILHKHQQVLCLYQPDALQAIAHQGFRSTHAMPVPG